MAWSLPGLVQALSAGKYSRESNKWAGAEGPPAEFHLVRFNQVWEKVQQLHLSAVRLAELHSDLRIQEKDEL